MPMLKSSILTDPNVLRWFTFLAGQKAVKTQIIRDQKIQEIYKNFQRNLIIADCAYLLLALGFLALAIYRSFYCWTAVVVFAGIIWKLKGLGKQLVAQIGERIILNQIRDYEQKTLFQITEILGKNFAIPSLTDILSVIDNVSRRAVIAAFMLAFFIIPFSLKGALIFLIGSYAFVAVSIRTPLALRYMKRPI